jgi:hypothetical protein
MSQGNSVSIVTGFDSRQGQGRDFFSVRYRVQTSFGAHRASYTNITWGSSENGHLHLVLRLRMHGALSPLSSCA